MGGSSLVARTEAQLNDETNQLTTVVRRESCAKTIPDCLKIPTISLKSPRRNKTAPCSVRRPLIVKLKQKIIKNDK